MVSGVRRMRYPYTRTIGARNSTVGQHTNINGVSRHKKVNTSAGGGGISVNVLFTLRTETVRKFDFFEQIN